MGKIKLYIAGPITGHPDYREKFCEVADRLSGWGYVVLNPAELPEGMAPADYMRVCLAMVDTADAVVLLPDWGDSAGALVEVAYARYVGKPVVDAPGYDLLERIMEAMENSGE